MNTAGRYQAACVTELYVDAMNKVPKIRITKLVCQQSHDSWIFVRLLIIFARSPSYVVA